MIWPLLALAHVTGCPGDDAGTTDHVHACPHDRESTLTVQGIDRSETSYHDGPASMVPGSTQLVTVGRRHEAPYTVDFGETFDAEMIGADGIDLVRISDNQFLLRATGPGSACVELFDPANPDDAITYGIYAMHPLRMSFRPNPDFAPPDVVYAWGTKATLRMQSGGGHDIVDAGLKFVTSERTSQAAWDTIRLFELGVVPIEVITSDGIHEHLELEVVSRPDEISVSGTEIPVALPANHTTSICVYGRHQGRVVGGLEWTFAVTNANWTTNAGSGFGGFYSGCVQVHPTTPGQRVEITARTGGLEHVLAYDVY